MKRIALLVLIAVHVTLAHAQAPVPASPKSVEPPPTERGAQSASVTLAIRPWGDVFVDDKPYGISPPLKTLNLTPGKYTITIKNSTYESRTETVELKTGDKHAIRHAFTDERPSSGAARKGY
ncbi:MAG: PEGA domain-containing protein [Betaproteobacteria bacterium]